MIKAIIFDLGGVVLSHSFEDTAELMAKNFSLTSKQVKNLYDEQKNQWSLGKITIKDFARRFKDLLKTSQSLKEIINTWKNEHQDKVIINQAVLKIVDSLGNNYKVILLTNTIDLHFNVIAKSGVYSHFDRLYASFKLGARKPDKKIFKRVLNENHLKPQEVVFIDDNSENIAGAKIVGMKTIHFKEENDLAEKLISFKVKL